MPTIEESAAAFRAGRLEFECFPDISLEQVSKGQRCIDDFVDGWRSAQREQEIERHIDEEANAHVA